tara:strand:+ start:3666 stop:3908 length:243 start_codon:yes stop_codon:yes gene_type:complete
MLLFCRQKGSTDGLGKGIKNGKYERNGSNGKINGSTWNFKPISNQYLVCGRRKVLLIHSLRKVKLVRIIKFSISTQKSIY